MYTHASSSMKTRRQAIILELIDREGLHSQELLRRRLRQRGFQATQATLSRDLARLGPAGTWRLLRRPSPLLAGSLLAVVAAWAVTAF